MGRYMIVVLKPQYNDDVFIDRLNAQLKDEFGAGEAQVFNTWKFLQEEADFMNNDPEGLQQVPDWPRPITAMQLHRTFFWLRVGELHIKLSACSDMQEAQNAIAVCKWIIKTKGAYIEKAECSNHTKKIVAEYLNHLFTEQGYDLKELWKQPQTTFNQP